MKIKLVTFFSILLFLYLLICSLLYAFQEKVIFYPQSVAKDFRYDLYPKSVERFVKMEDGTKLHALQFAADDPRGLVFYLHGNAGSLGGWGSVAETFTARQYDVFIPDYRGFGKSEGKIKSEAQLHSDVQTLYNTLKEDYSEDQIIVLGHSIGAGMAARLAAENDFKLLILQASPYSLPDLAKNITLFKFFPSFLLRYKFRTGKNVESANMPVVVLHGDKDEIVYYGSALKIQQHFKPADTLITLEGLGHNNFLGTGQYRKEILKVLKRGEPEQ